MNNSHERAHSNVSTKYQSWLQSTKEICEEYCDKSGSNSENEFLSLFCDSLFRKYNDEVFSKIVKNEGRNKSIYSKYSKTLRNDEDSLVKDMIKIFGEELKFYECDKPFESQLKRLIRRGIELICQASIVDSPGGFMFYKKGDKYDSSKHKIKNNINMGGLIRENESYVVVQTVYPAYASNKQVFFQAGVVIEKGEPYESSFKDDDDDDQREKQKKMKRISKTIRLSSDDLLSYSKKRAKIVIKQGDIKSSSQKRKSAKRVKPHKPLPSPHKRPLPIAPRHKRSGSEDNASFGQLPPMNPTHFKTLRNKISLDTNSIRNSVGISMKKQKSESSLLDTHKYTFFDPAIDPNLRKKPLPVNPKGLGGDVKRRENIFGRITKCFPNISLGKFGKKKGKDVEKLLNDDEEEKMSFYQGLKKDLGSVSEERENSLDEGLQFAKEIQRKKEKIKSESENSNKINEKNKEVDSLVKKESRSFEERKRDRDMYRKKLRERLSMRLSKDDVSVKRVQDEVDESDLSLLDKDEENNDEEEKLTKDEEDTVSSIINEFEGSEPNEVEDVEKEIHSDLDRLLD